MFLWEVDLVEDQSDSAGVLVSLEHEWERHDWAQWLHCTESELRHAVEAVGPDPDNVRRFLRQAR